MATTDPTSRLPTRAVQGATPRDVVLVAGGDTLLAPGRGTAASVAGRAGLDDLARQTARSLTAAGVHSIRLHLDDRLAAGPRYAPGWEPVDIAAGLTGAVAMLGLSTQRPHPGHPTPADPAMSAARAFRTAAGPPRRHGRDRDRPDGRPGGHGLGAAPRRCLVRPGRRRPRRSRSPTATTPSPSRWPARPPLTPAARARARLRRGRRMGPRAGAGPGIDVAGVTMLDSSGLSRGTVLPARILGDVLVLAAARNAARPARRGRPAARGGAHRHAARPLPHPALPPRRGHRAGQDRHAHRCQRAGGTVVDRDGRLLLYVVLADEIPPGVGTLTARAALDRFVAALATCGCR